MESENGTVVVARDVTRRYGEGETAVDALRGVSGSTQQHADADLATLCTPVTSLHEFLDPNVVKVVTALGKQALYSVGHRFPGIAIARHRALRARPASWVHSDISASTRTASKHCAGS